MCCNGFSGSGPTATACYSSRDHTSSDTGAEGSVHVTSSRLGSAARNHAGPDEADREVLAGLRSWIGTREMKILSWVAVAALFLLLAKPTPAQITGGPFPVSGSWTPIIAVDGTPGTPTFSVQVGTYEKVGRQVTVRFNVATTAWTGSPTGNLSITGLPFPAASVSNDVGVCLITQYNAIALTANYTQIGGQVGSGSSSIPIVQSGSGQTAATVAIGAVTVMNIVGYCSYHT